MILPENTSRRILFAVLFVSLSTLMALLMVLVGGRVKFYIDGNPRAYAYKDAVWFHRTLKVAPEQTARIHDLLLQYKEEANEMDKEDLERWEHLFDSFADGSDADLHRQMEEVNRVGIQRNELRLKVFLALRQQLDEEQKQQYGRTVSNTYRKRLQKLLRVFDH